MNVKQSYLVTSWVLIFSALILGALDYLVLMGFLAAIAVFFRHDIKHFEPSVVKLVISSFAWKWFTVIYLFGVGIILFTLSDRIFTINPIYIFLIAIFPFSVVIVRYEITTYRELADNHSN